MLFDSWQGLLRVLVVGTLAYGALVLLLRVSGKRTLAKMNAFDLVVTVALGSTLASILLTESVALAEGLLGLALLVTLQYVVAWASVRSARVRRLVKSEPRLLVRKGRLLEDAMRLERVGRDEVMAALRASGVADPGSVEAVILETDGSISVVATAAADAPALAGLEPSGRAAR